MSDIARVAGVSKNTVSLALRGSPRLSAATCERIRLIADQLGYCKNPTVAHLMAQLRSSRPVGFKATLALLNAHEDPEAFHRHPTIPTYIEGVQRRAGTLGYGLDEFWLHAPDLDSARLSRIFRSRGISGILIVGLMNENRLPARLSALWNQFPCVVTGVRTQEPTLSFVCVDHHALALNAFEKALQLGYRRPALVLDRAIDKLIDGRFTSGIAIGQRQLADEQRVRPFYMAPTDGNALSLFGDWLETDKPDVLLTLYHVVRRWLTELNRRVPEDIGLIQLEWRRDHADWAGMEQHNDLVGETAVEMLVGMIQCGDVGIPSIPRSALIGSTWVDGKTVRN